MDDGLTISILNTEDNIIFKQLRSIGIKLPAHDESMIKVTFASKDDLHLAIISGIIEPWVVNGRRVEHVPDNDRDIGKYPMYLYTGGDSD